MAVAGGVAAAAAASFANAIKASGVVIEVSPAAFQSVLRRVEHPLVIYAEARRFFSSTNYQYLVSYKGFAFVTKSSEAILLPAEVETILAGKIWLPG